MINESSPSTMPEIAILSQRTRVNKLFYCATAFCLLFIVSGSALAAVSSRPAAGVDPEISSTLFLERANELLSGLAKVIRLESGDGNFLANVSVPPNAKKVGLLILVERDRDLIEKNMSRKLQEQLTLDGWPVLLASIEQRNQLPAEDRRVAILDILGRSAREIRQLGVTQVVAVVSSFSQSIMPALSAKDLRQVSHLVLLGDEQMGPLKLPASPVLAELREQGVGLLDLALQGTDKQILSRRRQTMDFAGYDQSYRLMLIPRWHTESQYSFIAKRLRVWLSGLNLTLARASN